ncbi:uncharacterized protein TRIVIDRAFT_191664 [Trichoderma virens Gv29-8]|uniref:Amidase domain-containing protein n=1 Tax=Hypocrea virens (strain Gv29-8 / FGSC 10586) TaxID=413071 RepID=G9MT72_HYPVG|nr:uncharacterized protein TRIVIDRAFT_191664 [Trichoderma virens Gv29-8]EHK23114.1 hypothetical protein TRIVIDRAFT_191664 [Trichoderma virens Gv29-8]
MCSTAYFFRLAWLFSWPSGNSRRSIDLLTATAEDLQQLLKAGELTSVELVDRCFAQIDRHDNYLRAVLQRNPHARTVAATLDLERKNGHLRGPLHGIPILIKDNIATHPSLGMNTTGGSLALLTLRPSKSAEIIERVSRWTHLILSIAEHLHLQLISVGSNIMPGWSALGGQAQSAYTTGAVDLTDRVLGHSSPSGSSTGSAIGVSAGYSPLAIGTDTGGSLITPSTRAALYTLRPTMNLLPRDGLIPLSHSFDTVGPMAKSPADLANLLDILATPKGSEKTKFHSQMTAGDFRDFKIGFLSPETWFFDSDLQRPVPEATAQIKTDTRAAYAKIALTAKSFKQVELVSIDAFEVNGRHSFYDIQAARFKPTFEAYLGTLEDSQVRSLDELIRFNQNHAEKELPPGYDNQDQLQNAATMTMSDQEHDFLLRHARKVGRDIGIDKTLKDYDVDLVIAPADSPVNLLVSAAGYPSATMPLSYLKFNGRPIGLVAFTTAGGEEMLLNFLRAYENTFPKRRSPSHL